VGRIDDVCGSLCDAIKAALESSNVLGTAYECPTPSGAVDAILSTDGQVYAGEPLVPELIKILANPPGTWQISVFPVGQAKNATRFSPFDNPLYTPGPAPSVTASFASGVITFEGSIGTQQYNVHTVVNGDGDAFVQTTPNQSLADLATAVADAINGLGLDGVSAVAEGNTVVPTGASLLECNIGGPGATVGYEVGRYQRQIVATIWTNDPYGRSFLSGALVDRIGTVFSQFLPFADGSMFYIENSTGEAYDDDSQSSYSAFISRISFLVEYGLILTSPVAQLGAVKNETTLGDTERDIYVG